MPAQVRITTSPAKLSLKRQPDSNGHSNLDIMLFNFAGSTFDFRNLKVPNFG